MVADVFREQRRERARKRGREEERARWLAWLERREAAEREDRSFDEPPPGGWEGVAKAHAKLSWRRASGSRPLACL